MNASPYNPLSQNTSDWGTLTPNRNSLELQFDFLISLIILMEIEGLATLNPTTTTFFLVDSESGAADMQRCERVVKSWFYEKWRAVKYELRTTERARGPEALAFSSSSCFPSYAEYVVPFIGLTFLDLKYHVRRLHAFKIYKINATVPKNLIAAEIQTPRLAIS